MHEQDQLRQLNQQQIHQQNVKLSQKLYTSDISSSVDKINNKSKTINKPLNIAFVSDYYYPFVGGVQIHIKQLASLLNKHPKIGKVIIITHKYVLNGHDPLAYTGVKNHHGFKVYYLNIFHLRNQMMILPTFTLTFPQARRILLQEKIDIVHCHQSCSTLGLQYIFYARILGLKVVLTEHSIFGLKSIVDIHFNRFAMFFFNFCDYIIAVSKATRNNILIRSQIDINKVIVIPNGVSDVSMYKKTKTKNINIDQTKKIIKIITVGRMTYRRGIDLLIDILPKVCKIHHNIQILIVGDGPKRQLLQKQIKIHGIQSKVKVLGVIHDHQKLLQLVSQCDIFLNTPLTQSFGIALAQAAMLGLYCVSTNVGGVQQSIPSQLLHAAEVSPQSLIQVLGQAIQKVQRQQSKIELPYKFQYPWHLVCQRTIDLYQHIMNQPKKSRAFYIVKAIKTGGVLQIFAVFLGILLAILSLFPFFN